MLSAISWIKMTLTGQKLLTSMLPDMESKKILDPYSSLIRLAVLYFKYDGTKLSILDNKISYNEASFIQGTLRWSYGDNRNDLHNLYDPIKTISDWYIENQNEDINYLIKLSIRGLQKLKKAYKSSVNSSLVYHTLEHYINILKKSLIIVKRNKEMNPFDNENIIDNNENLNLEFNENNRNNFDENNNIENKSDGNLLNESKVLTENEINNIKRKINNSFKNMWNDNEIKIHRNILEVAYIQKKEGKDFEHNINAINKLLDGKDKQIINLLNKL